MSEPIDNETWLAFREQRATLVPGQVSRAALLGAPLTLLYIPAGYLGYPGQRALVLAVALLSSLTYLSVSRLVLLPVARRHVLATLVLISAVIAWVPGVLASYTGAISSPYLTIVLVFWYVLSLLPLSARQALVLCLVLIGVVLVALGLLAPAWNPHPVTLVNAASALFFVILGAHLQEGLALDTFVAQRRLDEARARLAALNGALEQTVEEQVGEIVRSAKEVDALNAQLRVRVKERSRELGRVLKRLSETRGQQALAEGQVLGDRVVIRRCIGYGGMGAVYQGHDRVTGRSVAVKILAGHGFSEELIDRFLKEAEAASAVNHPAIVRTLHVDVDAHIGVYHIQEYIEGASLQALLARRGAFGAARAAAIGAQVASALQAAHEAGVIHRDVKPSNVLVSGGAPYVHVLDFGISKLATAEPRGGGSLTRPGQILGTPAYMAPEQFLDTARAGAAADVYSLGILVYELTTGMMPYDGADTATVPSVMVGGFAGAPRDPRTLGVEISDPLAELLLACLRKSAAERPSAARVASALRTIAERDGATTVEDLLGSLAPSVPERAESGSIWLDETVPNADAGRDGEGG